jgi:aminoglycoside 3-N-acetyltransferase
MQDVTISISQLSRQLIDLGVTRGGTLLVHCAFSRVRPVEDGPHGLIAALRAALGPEGTLVMPSMAGDDETLFDPRATPCIEMGVAADTFWRMPGVLRSDSPHAFAAMGRESARVLSPHPVDLPHGLDSPVGRVYELDGQVLLLGVGHDCNTTIHLAECLAGVRYRRRRQALVLHRGRPTRIEYGEIDHCCQNFNLVDAWLDARGLQSAGRVGHARARLARSRDIVRVVNAQLKTDETRFLHPPGVDSQCDEARASLEPC